MGFLLFNHFFIYIFASYQLINHNMKILTIKRVSNNVIISRFGCDEVSIIKHGKFFKLLAPEKVVKGLRRNKFFTYISKDFMILADGFVIPKIQKAFLILNIRDGKFEIGELDINGDIKKISRVELTYGEEAVDASSFNKIFN